MLIISDQQTAPPRCQSAQPAAPAAFGVLLCQNLRCMPTVCQIQLAPLLASSMHYIQMRVCWTSISVTKLNDRYKK